MQDQARKHKHMSRGDFDPKREETGGGRAGATAEEGEGFA